VSSSRSFPGEVAAVSAARSFVESVLDAIVDDDLDAVRLMVSELAANSVRHADAPFQVNVDQADRRLRVEVVDAGEGTPTMQSPSPSHPSGRGLRIVDSLSDAWGVDQLPDGTKSVWFTLTLAPPRPSGAAPESSSAPIGASGDRARPDPVRARSSRASRRSRPGSELSSAR
jgi:anti-sigma regulatory factor (Ser/Thr protein kinase)